MLVSSLADELMERAVRPGVRAIDVAMLHRVVMDVIQMAIAVGFIADGVFPEAPLPDAARSLAEPGARSRLLAAAAGEERSREGGFDGCDSAGKIGIAIGQRDQKMQMIVQQDDRTQHKRVQLAAMLDGLAKQCARGIAVKDLCPPLGDNGEEERATGLNRPPIVGHRASLDQPVLPGNRAVGE